VVGGVVAVAEQLAEDRGGDAGGEREQRRGAAGLGMDAELAQAAADPLGPDVGARFGAGQQPRSGGLCVHGAEQRGEWVVDLDRVRAELEEDVWAAQVEVVVAEGDDAGDALAVEQDQAARDAGGRLERVVVE
jgi:hypothetical protein